MDRMREKGQKRKGGKWREIERDRYIQKDIDRDKEEGKERESKRKGVKGRKIGE